MAEKNTLNLEDNNLKYIIKVFLYYKWLILITTFLFALVGVIFSIISIKLPPEKSPLPNFFTSKAEMLISEDKQNSSVQAALNSSGLGNLSNLMGVSISTVTNSKLAEYFVHSNTVLDKLNVKFNLTDRYKITESPVYNTRMAIKKNLMCKIDEENGIFTISFTDTNPILARDVVNYTLQLLTERFSEINIDKNEIEYKNITESIKAAKNTIDMLQDKIMELEYSVSSTYNNTMPSVVKENQMLKLELDAQKNIYKQLKAQEELLKVEFNTNKPVFQILEYAEVNDVKSGPSRGVLCIIITMIGFFISLLCSIILWKLTKKKNII